jgi:hypothetical protein
MPQEMQLAVLAGPVSVSLLMFGEPRPNALY